jgi:hypothetical protein
MKTCCECGIEKDLIYFNKNKNLKDGLNNRCKTCCSNRNKNRYQSKKETIKQQTNSYYHKNKEIILEKTILILYNPFVAELKKAISNGPANTNFQFT